MGWFQGERKPSTIDARAGELRRATLAAAIDYARAPTPAPEQPCRSINRAAHAAAARMIVASGDINRLTGDWPTSPVSSDWVISRYQRTLVARSREQANNNDYMKAYLRLQRLNIVGPLGIQLHSQAMSSGKPDTNARDAIESWWHKWGRCQNCDIAGELSWRNIQASCCETAARDGEYFLRIITGSVAGPMGFALQVVDPQRCPVDMDRKDLPDGAFVRQGIEFNRYGKALAYYFEGADAGARQHFHNGKAYIRVAAEFVIHGFVHEMPGQKRGLPWMSTGLFRAKQTSAMEDAAVVNARVGASKMAFIEFAEGSGEEYDEEAGLEIDAEPGTIPVLPSGAKLSKFDPLYPTGELEPFVKLMHRAFAAGGGVAYHSLSQDLTDVNFSSIRHGTLDERETYKERQEWLREGLCDRVFEVALPRALLAGHVIDEEGRKLPAAKVESYLARVWQPRRWSWIDPRADVDAAESWKNNLLSSPSQLIRETGKDPHEVWKEIGEDVKQMRAAGIPDFVIAMSMGQKVAAAPGSADGKKEDSKP